MLCFAVVLAAIAWGIYSSSKGESNLARMNLSSSPHRVLSFSRADYPEGVPERGCIPLFALLRRRLSEEEVEQIAEELINTSRHKDVGEPVIRAAIEAYLHDAPLDSDVERVSERLAKVGFEVEVLEHQ